MPLEFKPLQVQQGKNSWKRIYTSRLLRRTILYMLLGGAISFAISFVGEGMSLKAMSSNDIFQSIIIGAFMGFFITNSPCARGKC